MKVKQIRCSSCGGSINLEADKACAHCGSAIAVLDEAAVEKALATLQQKETDRVSPSPERIAAALLASEESARRARHMPSSAGSQYGVLEGVLVGGGLIDLVQIGVGAALAAWLDD
ncbi:MAG: hypothetical protein IPP88_03780 [Betaproteobacteria bacterium]|nr:hypothetical protein [Betaproteobacteria bacterium]